MVRLYLFSNKFKKILRELNNQWNLPNFCVYLTETLVLSAKGSFDPDGVKYQTPIYNWQILTDEGGSIVKDGTSRVLSYEGFSISVNVQQNLNPDQKYKATLSYRVGSREATAEFIFEVKAGAPSQITLTEFATAQNPSKKIRMLAKVSSQSDIKEKPEWLIADGQIEGVTKGNNKRSLYVLSPGLLDEDLTYSVEVSVANVDATSTTTMSFKTNSKPIAGMTYKTLFFPLAMTGQIFTRNAVLPTY